MAFEDPIKRFVPDFKLSDSYATDHLTIRDCLSMHAGLPGPEVLNIWYEGNKTLDQVLAEFAKLPLPCGFRGCFGYQNVLYTYVSQVIEKIQKMSWNEAIQQRVFNPFQMTESVATYQGFMASANKALPHQFKQQKMIRIEPENMDIIAPSAGISSNAVDLAKWFLDVVKHSAQAPARPNEHATVWQELFTQQAVVEIRGLFLLDECHLQDIFFPEHHFLNYGYGWFFHDYRDKLMLQAPGYADGATSVMIIVPEIHLGVIVLNNFESPYLTHDLAFTIVDHYLNDRSTNWSERFAKHLDQMSQ